MAKAYIIFVKFLNLKLPYVKILFMLGAHKVQQIAKKLLDSVYPFPKGNSGIPPPSPPADSYITSSESLSHLISIHNLFCKFLKTDGVFAVQVRRSGKMESISPSVERIFGYTPSELQGMSGFAFIHHEDWEQVQKEGWNAREEKSIQVRCKNKRGEWQWTRFFLISPEKGEDTFFVLGFYVDLPLAAKEKKWLDLKKDLELSWSRWLAAIGEKSMRRQGDLVEKLEEVAAILQSHLNSLKKGEEVI